MPKSVKVKEKIDDFIPTKDETLQICCMTWSSDHISELEEILQGASAATVNKQLVNYVIDNIEPVGWKAICRSNKYNRPVDFIVDVIHVSQEKLEAVVFVRELVNVEGKEERNLMKNFINQEICVPLIELYPMVIQENTAIDIEKTTEVIEQVRFFFTNIWQPWDSFEDLCVYEECLIANRMQIYDEMQSGLIPPGIASEMRSVKGRAKEVLEEIHALEEEVSAEEEVDQRDVVRLMRLNKGMENLKARYYALRDPLLRELTVHQEQLERKDMMACSPAEDPANVLVVAASVSAQSFAKGVAKLPDLLHSLPQGADASRVKTFPSLQMALDFAQPGAVVALLPGSHLLNSLGLLAQGGTLVGLDAGVEIVGCLATGDVMLDVDMSEQHRFVLQSVCLSPLENQTGVSLHKGRMLIQSCSFRGGYKGVSLLSGSECKVEDCELRDMSGVGLECKSESKLIVGASSVGACGSAALKVQEKARITITTDIKIFECPIGVSISGSKGQDSSFKKDLQAKIILEQEGEIKFSSTAKTYAFDVEEA